MTGWGFRNKSSHNIFEQGIGVSNVNERLRVLFGPGYRMEIDSRPGQGTQTLIEIPELALSRTEGSRRAIDQEDALL